MPTPRAPRAVLVVTLGCLALGPSSCGGEVDASSIQGAPDAGSDVGAGTGGSLADAGSGGSTGSCCSAHPGAGCKDPLIAQCVCANDPFCCQAQWDEVCATQVVKLGCGSCIPSGGGGAGGSGAAGGSGGTTTSGGGTSGVGGAASGGAAATGGSGGGAACDPTKCPPLNAPSCCVTPSGPCGLQQNDQVCVENQCAKPVDACRTCLCSTCGTEFQKCLYYAGCEKIADCMLKTKCTDCYTDSTCKSVIDLHGGWGGPQQQVAESVRQCASLKGCACP
ncbi:MAG: hypothetical protein HS104_31735 [Polyangiaceae bacterium]|nr:hypothetical protein [Polyangiaceae bacterium]MCL4749058.1 hypothetical protein [Myxococcales bacterium]